ncbi:hypothetical protein RCL_jg22172.t1 [Rhizophagus clarus]|nr:hypothetical protein RCL_jg22172.t1 [Rhizophagus clarus]
MSRVNELKLSQQQHKQAITSINNQYKEKLPLILLEKPSNNLRRNSADKNLPNTSKSQSNNYYTRSPITRNINKQYFDYDSDNHEYLAQQSVSSSQQESFQPSDEDTNDIEIHTVTADSKTTGQPSCNISSFIPTNWGIYPRSEQ